jgi:HEAT repeat protein
MESPPPTPRAAVRENLLETGRVRALVDRLYKAVRAVLLYPSASPLPADFQRALHEGLTEYFAEHESLVLAVRDNELLHDGQSVHKDIGGEIDLTGPLGRDGIETITFQRGVTLEELVKFLELIKQAVKERNPDEDLVTLFWEAAFRRIRYKVVSGIREEDAKSPSRRAPGKTPGKGTGAGTGAGAGPGVAGGESGAMAAGGGKTGAPGAGGGKGGAPGAGTGEGGAAASAASDSGDHPAAAEAAKTASVARILNQLSDFTGDIAQRDAYRLEAARFDPVASTIGIVLEVLAGEESLDGFAETCGLIDSLYDRLLDQADFGPALRIHDGLKQGEKEEAAAGSARAQLLRDSRLRAADKIRVGKIVVALNTHACRDLDGARRLLTELPEEFIPHLAAALGEIEHIPARKMACDILAERGAAHVDEIGAMIHDGRWFVVRNAAQVLSRIGGPRATEHLEKAVSHPDPKVRRAVLDGAARIPTAEASRVLRAALADPTPDLQLRALRALSGRRDADTGAVVERRVLLPDFRKLKSDEQQDWLSALARIRGDEALPALRRLIALRLFFNGGSRRYLRLVAISALGECGGPASAAYLAELAQDRDELVRDTAALALDRAGREGRG